MAARWLLTRSESTGDGRTRLWFLIDNTTRRVMTAWGDPVSDLTVARCGEALVTEQDIRPVGRRYTLSDEPAPPS